MRRREEPYGLREHPMIMAWAGSQYVPFREREKDTEAVTQIGKTRTGDGAKTLCRGRADRPSQPVYEFGHFSRSDVVIKHKCIC